MNKSFKSQRALWGGLAVAILLGVIWQFTPLADAQDRMGKFPLIGLEYKGRDIPLKPHEEKFLKDVNVIKRIYTLDNHEFFITILDGTRNRHVVHDPYYCFRGSGWTVMTENRIPIKKGQANHLVLNKESQKREALFWFSDGHSQYTSPMKYWLQATLRRVTLGLSGPEPVLIVVQPVQEGKIDWARFSRAFHALFEL